MGERRISIADVARDTGINRGVITRLYHETALRVDLEIIETICVHLECELSDLFTIQENTSSD